MTKEDIRRVRQDYVAAARPALAAGFDWLELHFAHGYLAQSFLSPHSNQRDDEYGGSLQNGSRLLIETLDAVRARGPENRPPTLRLWVIEFDGRADTFNETIDLDGRFPPRGFDLVDV